MDGFKELVVSQIKAMRPAFLSKKPHFHFISVHYFYIIGLALLGSVIVYGAGRGNISYTDALFLASCASTQAGLNTVDINQLNTFQQVVLYLWPMLANPITINAGVVFLRLYWFEKRFQHIAREARLKRGTVSKSKSRANRLDGADAEKGVNGRKITVMLNGARPRITNDGILLENDPPPSDEQELDLRSPPSNHSGTEGRNGSQASRKPEIKFARTVTKSDGLGKDNLKLPRTRSEQEHIDFLERQRNRDDEVLRIPNPRDVERGVLPERVQAGDEEELDADPQQAEGSATTMGGDSQATAADNRGPAITIEEPDRRKLEQIDSDDFADDYRAALRTFSLFKLRMPQLRRKSKRPQRQDSQSGDAPRVRNRRQSFQTVRSAFSREKVEGTPYLSWEPTIGRNSAFPDLTEEQRDELGGIEYRSLKTLAIILTGYFWGYMAIGIIGLLPWILHVHSYGQVVDNAGVSRVWWAFFTASSAFMDLGFTLTPNSMNSFNRATWPLLLMSYLIVIGNTGFPIMLRCIIWIMSHIVPVNTGLYEELRFLLDHPRRCFTLLFPSGATWWLFWLLVVMNGLDVMFFIVLDLGSGPVVDLPAGIKVLNGIFEAVSTRTAGFSCVNLAELHPAVQFSYMVMMYISVFPIAISVRRTNVYEEKSLGVYSSSDVDEQTNQSDLSYVGSHLRRQLSFDLWYIVLGFFVINIAEGKAIMADEFSMFSVLFEVVSAYGTVGMSLGHPSVNASLCSQFSVVGKLVLIAMMVRGRHRGLPYGLDRAILLPSESLNARDAADASDRMARLQSHTSAATGGPRTSIAGRRKSAAGEHGNLLTSLLHPGPAVPVDPDMTGLHRRSTDPGHDEPEPYATRVTSRRTEPGVTRRWEPSFSAQRPGSSAGED